MSVFAAGYAIMAATWCFFAKFIHDYSVPAAMLFGENTVEKGGFPRTKKTGQNCYWHLWCLVHD